jgi:hypothetical protein
MIHEEICTYELAKLAKEKGFNEECRDFYCDDKLQKRITRTSCNRQVTSFDYCSNSMLEDYDSPKEYYNIAAPTQSLLQRWLREEKSVTICVDIFDDGWFFDISTFYKQDTGVYEVDIPYKSSNVSPVYDTYELALEDALKYALENLV